MLNSKLIDFLKIINKVTNTIILRYPNTVGISEDKDLVFAFDLNNFDNSEFDKPLGLGNLSSFLNMFNLFGSDREVTLDENIINVSDDETQVKYILSNTEALLQYDANYEQFSKTESMPTVLEFDLTQEIIKKLKTAASCFSELNTIVISGNDESSISLIQTESREKMSSNNVKININKSSEKNFTIGIGILTLLKLPLTDYNLKVKLNVEKEKFRILLENTENNFKIILPVLANKNFGLIK